MKELQIKGNWNIIKGKKAQASLWRTIQEAGMELASWRVLGGTEAMSPSATGRG